ncbi:Coatomer_gamma subunit [Hexamita inflata]|uniref:Coatomer gamma subunit n=1 Tax=Hexamita inflata TaxID=28002 RepID=A0AA86PP19_9EUKA|nr:Coatomer gamma subunit [Hexamita inflata]
METTQAMNQNLNLAYCLSEAKYLGEKGQSLEQQRLVLTRLLFCLNQPDFSITPKQAEELFFQVTKTFQNPSQHVHALAIMVIRKISPQVKSAFFSTRSLVQIYEKEPAMQPQAIRALGAIANQASLADVQKLVRISTLDTKNSRLAASGAIAAKQQNIQIDQQLVDKFSGAAAYCICDAMQVDKIIQQVAKSGNVYASICLLQKLQTLALDDRKKLQIYLQFVPSSLTDCLYEKLASYLSAIQAIAQLQYSTIKPQINVLFQAFTFIFAKAEEDHEKIAILRQILKIYSSAINNQATKTDMTPLNNLLQNQLQSSNQTIQTLATIHLITSTKDPQTIVKLSALLPSLSGELKQSALDLIFNLTRQPEIYSYLVPILQQFLKSLDTDIRRTGFQSISEIVKLTDDLTLKSKLTYELIENFDDVSDANMTKQICDQLAQLECQTEAEAKQLSVSLWQRALLDNVQVRLASIQALSRLSKQFSCLQPILQQVVAIQSDGFVSEIIRERDNTVIENFNLDDIINNSAALINQEITTLQFKKPKPVQNASTVVVEKQHDSDLIKLNKNFKNFKKVFTNSNFQQISKQNDDVNVEVCKVFYFQESAVEVMFVFKVSCDAGQLEEWTIQIGKENYPGSDSQITVIKQYKTVEEATLKKLSLSYILEGEEDEIQLDNIETGTYDLVSNELVADYAAVFATYPENEHKYTLAEMQSLDDVIDALPNNTGLRLEELVIEGKRASFWLVGTVLSVGEAIVKVEAKALKNGGVGVKLDFRGKAAELIQSFFE